MWTNVQAIPAKMMESAKTNSTPFPANVLKDGVGPYVKKVNQILCNYELVNLYESIINEDVLHASAYIVQRWTNVLATLVKTLGPA